jgi:hypothetical protein
VKRAALAIAFVFGANPGPAALAAGGDACSCQQLESLQQEVANADYEATFFAGLSERLKAVEDKQIALNKDPTNPDSGRDVLALSGAARADIMAREFHLPHPTVTGYTGPASVDMTFGSCTQKAADLEAMGRGSACSDVADITLKHEAAHRTLCEKLGAQAYWARMPSQIAAEEAARYADQSRAMRDVLKTVITAGTFKVSARMEPRVFGPQFDVTYSYVTDPMELKGQSAPGSDTVTAKSEGHQSGRIKTARIAGMTCTSSGQLNDAVLMSLDTDGFTMGLKQMNHAQKGDIKLRCKKGFGMSLRPEKDSGSGTIFSGVPLKLQNEIDQDVAGMEFAKYLRGGGMSVSGKALVTVELVCPGH